MGTGTKHGFNAQLRADTKTATLTGTSTKTVLQVGSGVAANWAKNEVFNIAESGSANNNRVRRIVNVDTVTNKLTIDPALPAVPAAGAVLGAGVLQWVPGTPSIRYRKPAFTTPVGDLLDAAEKHQCALLYGEFPDDPLAFAAKDEKWIFLAVGRDPTWCQGLADRLSRLLDCNAVGVTVSAQVISRMDVSRVGETDRDDQFYEWQVYVELTVSEVP